MWAAAGAAVALALALARFDPYLFTGGDNAHYYALARALATGRGYVDLVAPGAPPHTQYPPGYPALLVPIYLLFDGNYVALKLVSLVAAAVLLGSVYLVGRRDPSVPPWVAAGTVWMVGLYEAFQLYSHRVLSDMPYAALATASLAMLQPAAAADAKDRLDRVWVFGCALAVAAFYIRSAGVTLLAGIVGWALVRRHWRRAASAAGAFTGMVLPWFLWGRRVGSGGGYLETLAVSSPLRSGQEEGRTGEIIERLHETAVEYGTFQLPHLFWPSDPPPDLARAVGFTIGMALLAFGAWRILRSRPLAPWDLFVVASLAFLPFWPWLGDRYFLTLAPFLWILMLVGLDALCRRATGRSSAAMAAVALLAAALVAVGAARAGRQWDRTQAWIAGEEFAGYTPFWRDYFRAARWIGETAPEDAVIMARKPSLAWYWSGRASVAPPLAGRPERLWERVQRRGVTHILLEPWTESSLGNALHARAAELSVVYETPRREVVVLEIDRQPRALRRP